MRQLLARPSSIASVILLTVISGWAQPQQPGSTALERRAADVCAQFRAAPGDFEKLFAPEFLTQVQPSMLTPVFTKYFSQLGRCMQTKLVKSEDPNSGEFNFIFEKGFSVSAKLNVSAASPGLIIGLAMGNPVSSSSSLNDIVNELKALPGETSFLVARLNDHSLVNVVALNAESELAIGSTFKLYILSELAREVNSNQRKLTDVVKLDGGFISLPSGTLQTWPVGSPLTLHSLAAFMISISDNTAADQLLRILGRDRVEQVMSETGHARPSLNVPFLSTLEMFKLKGEPTHKAADEFLALDAAGRRTFLENQIANVKREDAKPYAGGKPSYIDRIEWFASVTDLCRVMNWLRQQTEGPKLAAPVRDIMTINTGAGLNISRERWSYIGFKGGSEPGVLNLTYLLQSTKGQWYAMALTWNNRQEPVDTGKIVPLIQRALQIIE
jgi:beta-lactamase class A